MYLSQLSLRGLSLKEEANPRYVEMSLPLLFFFSVGFSCLFIVFMDGLQLFFFPVSFLLLKSKFVDEKHQCSCFHTARCGPRVPLAGLRPLGPLGDADGFGPF